MKKFKPMLAAKPLPLESLPYPLFASPKLDGIRCLVIKGRCVTRNLKPFPNAHVRGVMEALAAEFGLKNMVLDGEATLPDPTRPFHEVSSALTTRGTTPDHAFQAFDLLSLHRGPDQPFVMRYGDLKSVFGESERVELVPQVLVYSPDELRAYEERWVDAGYEGLMARGYDSPYKFGRSTPREKYLVKVVRHVDGEAEVLGFEELMSNTNVQTRDALGRSKRSSHQENMVPMATLGALLCRDLETGVEFSLGTGFSAKLRDEIWERRKYYKTQIVKYRSKVAGVKNKPRHPVFLGFRHKGDMS